MTAPDLATVTESLERSMQNCSLRDRRRRVSDDLRRSIRDESDENFPISDTTLELNSHLSLPSHWEQCLDLKTGEIYYINWKNGMRVKEDPRKVMNADEESGESYGTVYSEEDSSYCDSEESSSGSSPSSREHHKEEEDEEEEEEEEDVLVVAGCKACFMYFMVPKLVEDCPKCASQLLHFGRPHHSASP